jgi:hypothetical protein
VHVAPSWRLRRNQIEDERIDGMGYIEPCYLCFAVFFVLGSRCILIF